MIELFTLIVYSICAYGISNMIVYMDGPFHVFTAFRQAMQKIGKAFGDLVSCMACVSTWVGIFFNVVNVWFTPEIPLTPAYSVFGLSTHWLIALIIDMGFTSGLVWLLHNLEEMWERMGYFEESGTGGTE